MIDREDEDIQRLFQQLREEDERNAPSFAPDLNNSLSRPQRRLHLWAVWPVAATALIILLGTGWWILFRQSTKLQAPIEVARSDTFASDNVQPVSSSPALGDKPSFSPLRSRIKDPHDTVRRHHPFVRPQPPAILTSQWRSPTESLLQTPGEQLYKKVPRLDESVVNIKAIISHRKD